MIQLFIMKIFLIAFSFIFSFKIFHTSMYTDVPEIPMSATAVMVEPSGVSQKARVTSHSWGTVLFPSTPTGEAKYNGQRTSSPQTSSCCVARVEPRPFLTTSSVTWEKFLHIMWVIIYIGFYYFIMHLCFIYRIAFKGTWNIKQFKFLSF